MLREIEKARQTPGELPRRWFTDEAMDLFVWTGEDRHIERFELTYGKPASERAVSWSRRHGLSHARVDDGSRPGQHPGTPLLLPGGELRSAELIAEFRRRAQRLDAEIANFVASRLAGAEPQVRSPREGPEPTPAGGHERMGTVLIAAFFLWLLWWLLLA